ncbi:MAG: membrane protein insertion efficiency factor YidD [Desulfuromonadales bacterium]|nr:membrane protein insertion efficiency factor YidD [Desulfuromonadales bacterium]
MLKSIALLAIRFYQKLLSPLLPSTCRFYPSCSEYSRESIVRHGVVRGTWLTLVRLSKCHPFHPGGFDPAP